MPLHDACYLAATDKIYGVRENYIIKFHADTLEIEETSKVCSPMYGPMRIVGDGATLYVASFADRATQDVDGLGLPSNRKIWNVDSSTLAATDVLGVDAKAIAASGRTFNDYGPQFMLISGGRIWFTYGGAAANNCGWIDLTTPSSFELSFQGSNSYMPQMMCTDGTSLYISDGSAREIEKWIMIGTTSDGVCSIVPYRATATEYATNVGKVYCTTEVTDIMLRIDNFNPDSFATLNLGAVFSGVRPMRLRYNSSDGKIYLPCQNQDVVIIWDPNTETGTYQDGFDSPIDVIFTPTKKFAVQTGLVNFQEIT